MNLERNLRISLLSLVLIICFCNTATKGQNIYKPVKTNDTLPAKYFLNPMAIINHTYEQAPDLYRMGAYDQLAYIHATHLGYRIPSKISSGYCYYNWPELENYLNEILTLVIPADYLTDTVLHVYVVKDGNINASMYASGQMLINIGAFDGISDEASMAYLMAHEFAHYYLHHSLQYYISSETGEFKRLFFNNQKLSLKYSLNQEQQADSLALEFIMKSGYDINCAKDVEQMLDIDEQHHLLETRTEYSFDKSDHPSATQRINMVNLFLKHHGDNKGKRYLISEEKFGQFRIQSRVEILKCLLNNFDYSTCIERAFKYHLLEPVNKDYIYYLLEAIRKKGYNFRSEWNELFITESYYNYDENSIAGSKQQIDVPLLEKFNKVFLNITDIDSAQIKAPFYWDGEIRFKTNEQAFNYFYKLSQKLQCHECVLTNALSFPDDSTARNKLLRVYLSYDDIVNRDFAEIILKDSVWNSLPQKQMIVLNNVESVVRSGKNDLPICINETDSARAEYTLLDGLGKSIPEATMLFLPELKNYDMELYIKLYQMMVYSFYSLYNFNSNANLYIMFPEYYDVFRRFGVNDIEFINCSYFEYRENAKTTEDFRKLSQLNLNGILSAEFADKYADVAISGIRMKKDRLPKYCYYNDALHMKFKDYGYAALLKIITYEYGQKCIFIKKYDFVK